MDREAELRAIAEDEDRDPFERLRAINERVTLLNGRLEAFLAALGGDRHG